MSAAQALVNVAAFDKAENFLKRAEGADPNNYRLHAIRGQMYTMEERNEDAIREYQSAIQNLPETVREGPLYPVGLHLSRQRFTAGPRRQTRLNRNSPPPGLR
jgi:tetratricopeptide (TPR) repeat protein